MKDQLIKAIDTFKKLYPEHRVQYISIWSHNSKSLKFRVIGVKGNSEIIELIKVDL